jgi:hypothetical protein
LRVYFTAKEWELIRHEMGLQELCLLLLDGRYMDPARFAHLRRELGLASDD